MKSEGIVDWEREAPQWPALLSAARGPRPAVEPADDTLWRIYGPLVRTNASHLSFVIGQMGQSLDGRIATAGGQSHYINGPAAILHLHRLRALVDAVVVGVGTAIADDPRLTVRHVTGPQPARVVIDPNGRLPASAKLLEPDGARRIVIGAGTPPAGVEHVRLNPGANGLAPADIIAALRDAGLRRILIEGGGQTVSRFLAAKALQRLHVMVSPMVIGAGPVGLSFHGSPDLKDAARPHTVAYALPGGDVLFDCEFQRRNE
jgi:diaminohydroxyphosphoribosylaminopyrimidine deaminase / 5-amino-6-(5-phosphoribosylamino)uracil reductase